MLLRICISLAESVSLGESVSLAAAAAALLCHLEFSSMSSLI